MNFDTLLIRFLICNSVTRPLGKATLYTHFEVCRASQPVNSNIIRLKTFLGVNYFTKRGAGWVLSIASLRI